jgi:hypothetical protein
VTLVETAAQLLRLAGLVLTAPGLWFLARGLRVVVSGRIDERKSSAWALRLGLPLLAVGVLLLVGGTFLANWAR